MFLSRHLLLPTARDRDLIQGVDSASGKARGILPGSCAVLPPIQIEVWSYVLWGWPWTSWVACPMPTCSYLQRPPAHPTTAVEDTVWPNSTLHGQWQSISKHSSTPSSLPAMDHIWGAPAESRKGSNPVHWLLSSCKSPGGPEPGLPYITLLWSYEPKITTLP